MKNEPGNYTIDEISEHIKLLTEEIHPRLIEYLRKINGIMNRHKVERFGECGEAIDRFVEFKDDLTKHIELEDYVIFPKILRAIRFDRAGLRDIKERLYASELTEWVSFHNVVREELDALVVINEIIDKCNLYELTGDYFREFESLLREHAEFEDEVLFPAALKLAINDLG